MADSSKTEKATPKRQKKAREEGQIVRSRELPGALALAAASGVLLWILPSAVGHWAGFYRQALELAAAGDIDTGGPLLEWSSLEVLRNVVPVLLGAMFISVVAGLGQGGFNLAPQALAPKFDRLNPSVRLGQIFSITALSGLLKSLLPFSAILWVAYAAMRAHWLLIVHGSSIGVSGLAVLAGAMVFEITWKSCVILLAWSGVDYVFTWRKMQSDLKMTKEEVREEFKETEGNPVIKRRIRQIQRQMRKRQSAKGAETANVIVTNPTHYAVALRYSTEMPAPVVVAKGRNLMADKIKQIGRENNIPLVENKPLAQALYKSAEIGDSIPASLYQAVAEILALVFRAKAELRRREQERRWRDASGRSFPRAQLNPPAGDAQP
jgi:flagellar biosynthetic protein FlhB